MAHFKKFVTFSFVTNSGKPFSYFTYGAACSLVEIDCLTGDHDVIRTDIVMDVGQSLNPAIDIGQVRIRLKIFFVKLFIDFYIFKTQKFTTWYKRQHTEGLYYL